MTMDKNMRDEIAQVAYRLYENRGCTPGNDFMDWLEAEKIVKEKHSKKMAGVIKSVKPTQILKALESAKSKSRGIFSKPSAK